VSRDLLHCLSKQVSQQAVWIAKHSLPSILQGFAYTPVAFLALELLLGLLLRFATDHAIAVEEAI